MLTKGCSVLLISLQKEFSNVCPVTTENECTKREMKRFLLMVLRELASEDIINTRMQGLHAAGIVPNFRINVTRKSCLMKGHEPTDCPCVGNSI